ncbi:MAG TPA: hypothetical protein VLN74_06925 [Ilumatobacteraceae bacterium]|nr:hypothetical protein [Ilumatobacteraceae bacterium]
MRASPIVMLIALIVTACGSEPVEVTDADYLADLQAVCADTTATLDALPRPPDQISVADFAVSAANALDDEAERARSLDVTDELAADHRALVRNTDEQAAAWRAISTTPQDDAAFGELTVRVGELIRGRNDLVDEMGAPGCRRGDV